MSATDQLSLDQLARITGGGTWKEARETQLADVGVTTRWASGACGGLAVFGGPLTRAVVLGGTSLCTGVGAIAGEAIGITHGAAKLLQR